MIANFFDSPLRIQELRNNPHGNLLEGFAQHLYQAGYTELTAQYYIRSAEHLIYWAIQKNIPITTLDGRRFEDFAQHLNQCQCPNYGRSNKNKKGARLFFSYLQHTGIVITTIKEQPTQVYIPILFTSFCHWMRQQRGTSDRTLNRYSLDIIELLKNLGEDPSKFDALNLRNFVLERSKRSGWGAAKTCTKAIRMFLRFLIADGKCAPGLDAAIPALAHWRLSSLPKYLQPDEVERVIASCDLSTQSGSRNRAILLLLARLGLRAGDIVQLRLCDINWKEAWLQVSGKGRYQTRLPLTQEIGDAIANYLIHKRPQTKTDKLFITAYAPIRALGSHETISSIVSRAMRRAGVSCPSRGAAHVLRHSAASSMLRQGASLQEIAAILRHRSIETTQIYAKVDVNELQQIAQPWPEVKSC
jgi:site-specific recombinase XerD